MRAVVIVKPGSINYYLPLILETVEQHGTIEKLRLLHPDRKTWELHYAPHKGKDFFDRLINYMVSGPVVVAVVRLDGVSTAPLKQARDNIRKRQEPFRSSPEQNVIHTSDGHADAVREVLLWEPML